MSATGNDTEDVPGILTSFGMVHNRNSYDEPEREEKWMQRWEEEKLFVLHFIRQQRRAFLPTRMLNIYGLRW
jgi:hypothetical protein